MHKHLLEKQIKNNDNYSIDRDKYSKNRLIELFSQPQITLYHKVSANAQDQQKDPTNYNKNNRYKRVFEQELSKDCDNQSISTISKQMNHFRSRIHSPLKKSYNDEALFPHDERSGSLDTTHKGSKINRYRKMTQCNNLDNNHFISIQQNLSQCDKILLKLQGTEQYKKLSNNPGRKLSSISYSQEVCPTQPIIGSKIKIHNFLTLNKLTNQEIQKKCASTEPNNTPKNAYTKDTKDNTFIQKNTKHTQSFKLQSQKDLERIVVLSPQKPQSSIIELRRQRINEILANNKKKNDNLLQLNFNRIRQREVRLLGNPIKNQRQEA